jgi:membrane associated rhomboid family serine protease
MGEYFLPMTLKQHLRKPLPYGEFNVALILIAVNLGVFLITNVFRDSLTYLAMNPILVTRRGFVWTIFTYMFAHANLNHLFFNMLGLFFFGTQVERTVGSWEFLMFYLLTGFLSGLFSLLFFLVSGTNLVFLLGASGAVYGVLFAFAAFYPDAHIFVFGIIPVKSFILVTLYTFIELFSQLQGRTGVAHLTHLAGFGFAYLFFLIRYGKNPIREWFGR